MCNLVNYVVYGALQSNPHVKRVLLVLDTLLARPPPLSICPIERFQVTGSAHVEQDLSSLFYARVPLALRDNFSFSIVDHLDAILTKHIHIL